MRRYVVKGIMLVLAGSLVACSQPTDSVTAHTKSYVFKAKDDFDPNFATQISDTIKMMEPVFKVFHDEGIQDRQAGMTREQAQQKAANYKNAKINEDAEVQKLFINRSYSSTLTKKQQQLFLNEAMATYLDGFEGR
ncbi:Exc2 family lipoprotein [Erwiniaceae bacterium CAU 1747]